MSNPDGLNPTGCRSGRRTEALGSGASNVVSLIPGLMAATLLACASIWLSETIGVTLLGFNKTPISAVMVAVLLGLVIGAAVRLPQWLQPGVKFAVKKVLRLGIILLGIRLTIYDVFRLGTYGVPIVLTCIVGALVLTTVMARWLRVPHRLGTLIAVGTSICGVSAIVATGPTIDAKEEEVAYAVAVITIFGLLATLAYPYLASAIFGTDTIKAGLFLGTAVHDTSQVVGSATVYSDVFSAPLALDTATVTKLVRNVFMAVVIPVMSVYSTRRTRRDASVDRGSFLRLLPLFVLGFLVVAGIRSVGDAGVNAGGKAFGLLEKTAWTGIHSLVKGWAGNLLVVALAGVGLSTDMRTFRGIGIKPFLVGLVAALSVGLISFIAISLLGSLVSI